MGKLADLGLTFDEVDQLVTENPSLYSFILGYAAELKFLATVLSPYLTDGSSRKPDDHDRLDQGDRVFDWNGVEVRMEVKSLQSASVKDTKDPGIRQASFQVDASDKRPVLLPNGHTIETTCLKVGSFDILAVNMWAMFGCWKFAYCLNEDLPRSKAAQYTEEDRKYLLATSMTLREDLRGTKFTWNLQELLLKVKAAKEALYEDNEDELSEPVEVGQRPSLF